MTDRNTPPAVIVGDQFAAGIAYKMPEVQSLTRPGLSSDGLQALINSSFTWSTFKSDPWIVIATGTYDGDYDAFQDLKQVRDKISYLNPEFRGRYPYVLWVLPLNNNYSRSVIKRVAAVFDDTVIDMPQYLTSTVQVPSTQPVYYPYPWSQIFNSPPTVWYNQTTYSSSSTKTMLTDNNVLPNQSGFSWVVDAIRKATGNWTISQPTPPEPPGSNGDENNAYWRGHLHDRDDDDMR